MLTCDTHGSGEFGGHGGHVGPFQWTQGHWQAATTRVFTNQRLQINFSKSHFLSGSCNRALKEHPPFCPVQLSVFCVQFHLSDQNRFLFFPVKETKKKAKQMNLMLLQWRKTHQQSSVDPFVFTLNLNLNSFIRAAFVNKHWHLLIFYDLLFILIGCFDFGFI